MNDAQETDIRSAAQHNAASASRNVTLLILGSGPAGYSAAIYAARANLSPVLLSGLTPGGQLTVTSEVENYPGFAEPIMGPELMQQMRAQAERYGTVIIDDIITEVDFSAPPYRLRGDSGTEYRADSVIIATGAQARWLNLPSEEQFRGFGVSACATCDGFFFRNKKVAVIGGGNSAVEEALYLTHHASEVVLIHRRDSLRAERILQERLFKNPKISVMWNQEVLEIMGNINMPRKVTGLKLASTVSTPPTEQIIAIDGVFVAIGHDPATQIFRGQLPMDDHGYLLAEPDSTLTAKPGIFAAGDVKDKVFRQAVTAAGMGCMAALEAERYLAK
ncbi:MAG: thioredoxin-disulfide reductase [Alphaproteobacteria bacterium]|nr:thioredoxin-disulfide reductase [Alphaproteobacteria bacterium]